MTTRYYLSVIGTALVVALLLGGVGVYVYAQVNEPPVDAPKVSEGALPDSIAGESIIKEEPAPVCAHMSEPKRKSEHNSRFGDVVISHPSVGTTAVSEDGAIRLTLIDKRQNYGGPQDTHESAIHSPKSVNIHPNGQKYYVNSLEGAKTVVFRFEDNAKLSEIRHEFDASHRQLWAPASGLWPVTHYVDRKQPNTFTGKPVESTFSHDGRYLWIPYYRRSYDINAQDPSALAVIDTKTDQIVRLFETGPLPKMIQTSPDGKLIAVTHWGNNTVGILDIASDKYEDWHYIGKYVVDYELPLNYSLSVPVDRDSGSGYALRGTVFTPDNHYLLVGCMGGGGGIAVVDVVRNKYLGRMTGMMGNTRHLVLREPYLYTSVNAGGCVQRMSLDSVYKAIERLDGTTAKVNGIETCNVLKGARTLCLSPDGRYAYVACNNVSQIAVVDTRTMRMVLSIAADSYPVGMDMSACGRYLITTSQGRKDHGGNAVDIYKIEIKN